MFADLKIVLDRQYTPNTGLVLIRAKKSKEL